MYVDYSHSLLTGHLTLSPSHPLLYYQNCNYKNPLRYADDTTLMAETKEELNSLWMKVKEESEKASLKLNVQNTKIMTVPLFMHAQSLQSCPTLCDPMDCSMPGFSDYGDSPGKILEWVAMPASKGSS